MLFLPALNLWYSSTSLIFCMSLGLGVVIFGVDGGFSLAARLGVQLPARMIAAPETHVISSVLLTVGLGVGKNDSVFALSAQRQAR